MGLPRDISEHSNSGVHSVPLQEVQRQPVCPDQKCIQHLHHCAHQFCFGILFQPRLHLLHFRNLYRIQFLFGSTRHVALDQLDEENGHC